MVQFAVGQFDVRKNVSFGLVKVKLGLVLFYFGELSHSEVSYGEKS